MKTAVAFAMLACAAALAGCDTAARSAKGFRLPPGDVDRGKAAFVELKCHTCHTVEGADLPPAGAVPPVMIKLGGEVLQVKTYGELVTSVIYPTHGLAEGFTQRQDRYAELSPMPEFNHLMTVSQLIDIVHFLQAHYFKLEPESWVH